MRPVTGRRQVRRSALPGDIFNDEATFRRWTLPQQGGGYRLFAYVSDEKGGAAVANVPLYIDPQDDAPETADR